MEVTEEEYKSYYKDKRRQKYIDERACENGDVSYDALDTAESLGAEIFADTKTNVEEQVTNKIILEQLHNAFLLLSEEERELIMLKFFKGFSEVNLSSHYGISQQAISKRLKKVLLKIKEIIKL